MGNKISESILFWSPHVAGQQWYEAEKYAALVDRLVEASQAALIELQGAENPDQRTCYLLDKVLKEIESEVSDDPRS